MMNQSPARELSAKASKIRIPLDVTWEITKHCNLSCTPCYIVRKEEKEFSLSEGFSLIENCARAKTMYLTFTGGEPFLRKKELKAWAFKAQKKGMTVSIFTNATLMDSDDIAWVKDLSPFAVHISLFSTEPQKHDAITLQRGSFEKTVGVIKKLVSADVPVVIKTLLMKENFNERKDIIRFAQSLGAAWSVDPLVTPLESGGKKPLDHRLGAKQIEKIFDDVSSYVVPRFEATTPEEFICGAGTNMAAISAYGDVYPCLLYPKKAGNIRTNSFQAIWEGSEVFKQLRNIDLNDINACGTCKDLPFCSRCPGLALLEDSDDLNYSSSSCILAKITKKSVSKYRTA